MPRRPPRPCPAPPTGRSPRPATTPTAPWWSPASSSCAPGAAQARVWRSASGIPTWSPCTCGCGTRTRPASTAAPTPWSNPSTTARPPVNDEAGIRARTGLGPGLDHATGVEQAASDLRWQQCHRSRVKLVQGGGECQVSIAGRNRSSQAIREVGREAWDCQLSKQLKSFSELGAADLHDAPPTEFEPATCGLDVRHDPSTW
jgi:hypothetical protein